MKNKITVVLLICTLLISVVALTSCGDITPSVDDTTVPETQPSLPLEIIAENYKIIRAEKASDALIAACAVFRTKIVEATGGNIGISEDWLKKGDLPDDNAYEILVGSTNRPQSEAALAKIEGVRFTVEVVGNKIVIIGTNDSATVEGMNYFFDSFVSKSLKDGKFTVPSTLSFISEPVEQMNIVKGGQSAFKIVRSEDADAYIINFMNNIVDVVDNLTGVKLVLGNDWIRKGTEPDSGLSEILVGDTNRPETKQFLSELKAAEYGYKIIGNKVVVCGHNPTTTGLAVNEFLLAIKGAVTNEADGNKGISLMLSAAGKKVYSKWYTDIPDFENGTFSGTVDNNNDALQYYITDTTETAYKAYREKLASQGFTLYTESEAAGNLFATYTKDKASVHVYFTPYNKTVRIITEPNPTMPPVTPETYEKITTSKMTQMRLNYATGNFGMAYIITLEDGRFIIYDGGGSTGEDYKRLYNLLGTLNERPDKKIIVAAWIITHDHWDHYSVFNQIADNYAGLVKVEKVICNTPSTSVKSDSGNPGSYTDANMFTAFNKLGGVDFIKPHTGQVLCIGNAKIRIMYSHEDLHPAHLSTFNDSTMVTRMEIGGQVITFLGDMQTAASKVVVGMYGSYLKSDIIQVAHHGYDGASLDVYKNLAPSVVFWPTDNASFTKQTASNSGTYTAVDYYVRHSLGAKEILVADTTNKTIILPYTANSNTLIERE